MEGVSDLELFNRVLQRSNELIFVKGVSVHSKRYKRVRKILNYLHECVLYKYK